METHLEGNILHQDEWSMSTAPPEFPLLSVLLRNLLVHVPPFIHFMHKFVISSPNPDPFVAF